MYIVNKIVGYMIDPSTVAAVGFVWSLAWGLWQARRRGGETHCHATFAGPMIVLLCVGVWMWLWSMPLMGRWIGAPLEAPYLDNGRIPKTESFPKAEAIVLHGGSMSNDEAIGGRGEMCTGADRVWKAAQLWKAGKAPVIYATGEGVKATTAQLLEDFGVPTNVVMFADASRNTEEEARFVATLPFRHVLVVTSAWHMRRTLLMYVKYAPQIMAIPAGCDFENTVEKTKELTFLSIWPNDEALTRNRVAAHEWVGILGYQFR